MVLLDEATMMDGVSLIPDLVEAVVLIWGVFPAFFGGFLQDWFSWFSWFS